MKALATLAAAAILTLGLVAVASADPPGQEPCGHGNSNKPCREDPQPDHGKDCLEHGNGGQNEDHCLAPTATATPTPAATNTPSVVASSTATPTLTATETITATPTNTPSPTPTPSLSTLVDPTPAPATTIRIVPVPQVVIVPAQPAIQRQPAPPVVIDVAPARTPAFSPPRSGDGGLVGR